MTNCLQTALFSGSTRNTFRQIICKSNRYMNSFFPDAVASWNIFIKHFDDVLSFDILKKHINAFFRPKNNNIFGIHDPSGLRYLFQLRLSLSPLRSHKFRHNFADTLLRYVGVIKALKIRIISYFHVLTMQPREQP